MELRHLRYFVAVAEELSFTRASERLFIAQPSLSTQMKQLELELGVELFNRSRRTIRLTDAGRVLLDDARQVLAQVDQTVELVRRVGSGGSGQLSIGFVPSASNLVLPRMLDTFRRDFPDVELFLREMPPDEVRRSLHERRIDVGFLMVPFDDETLSCETIVSEPLIAAIPAGHPLARARSVTVASLAAEPFILPRQYSIPGYQARVLLACERAGVEPRVVQKDIWLMQTVIALVAGGIGVALVPASEQHLHREGVVYRALDDDVPTVDIGVAWRRDDRSAALDGLVAACRGVRDELSAYGAAGPSTDPT
jgi:DNA-binding transcriptional LysR family regulator